jgi:hypothetical protein
MSQYNSFTLDNLPPGIDKNQCFTSEQFYRVPEDFPLEKELAKYVGKPPLPASTNIRQVRLFVERRLSFSWDDGVITFQLYLPNDFQMNTLCATINGELAYDQWGDEVVLDRTQYVDVELPRQKSNYMAMEL